MASANVANTKVVPVETTLRPFYDDFDESRNFYRILFRPGYAVQARELTQLQTILQNQIERFGNHIFQNGSLVLGGAISLDTDATYLNLQTSYANTAIVADNFKGNNITLASGNAIIRAYVFDTREATSNDPPTLFIKYFTGTEFSNTSEIKSSTNVYANIATTGHTGSATLASINDGIFFINGFFVKVPQQTIVVDKYSVQANAKVGLEYTTEIIDQASDSTLLDPAQEASNYQAPGASRLKINFDLSVRTLDSEDDAQFVELLRVENGQIKKQIRYPIYSELGETLARRTFDESGNYTVRRFQLNVYDHPTDNTKVQIVLDPGKAYIKGYEYESIAQEKIDVSKARTTANSYNQDVTFNYGNYLYVDPTSGFFDGTTGEVVDIHCLPSQFVNFSSSSAYNRSKIGTAHVREFRHFSATNSADLSTAAYKLSLFDTRFANIRTNSAVSLANISANGLQILDSPGVFSSNNNAYVGATIRIITGSGNGASHTISSYNGTTKTLNIADTWLVNPLANSNVSVDFSMKDAESIIKNTTYTGSSASANANIDVLSKDTGTAAGNTYLNDITFNTLVFPFADRFIKASSMTNENYQYMGVADVTFSSLTSGAFSPGAGRSFVGTSDGTGRSAVTLSSFMAFSSTGARLNLTGVTVTGGTSAVLTNGDGYNGAAKVFYLANINSGTGSNPKSKALYVANTTHMSSETASSPLTQTTSAGTTTVTLYGISAGTNAQAIISNTSKTPNEPMSLFVSDVLRITKIYDLAGASTPAGGTDITGYADVTSKFAFDNGQRDSHYDHATISLRPRVGSVTGPLLVCFDWFSHDQGTSDGLGYFSVDSYGNIDYKDIPSYIASDGTEYSLRDCVDFRPKRLNASSASPNYQLESVGNVRFPSSGASFEANYQYYLSKKAHVTLTTDFSKPFKIVEGTPAVSPVEPRISEDSMVLYKLTFDPYTMTTSNVNIEFVENRRYTMRDIGKLESRIQNLEYYQTLSQLEASTTDMKILDGNGLERTKYGILADDFSTHGYGDVNNPDYLISVDKVVGGLQPAQNAVSLPLITTTSSGLRTLGTITTIDFTEEKFVSQNLATKYVPVQPYMLAQWVGRMTMNPPDDNWVETNKAPDIIINQGENDALAAANAFSSITLSRGGLRRWRNRWVTEANWWITRFGAPHPFWGTWNNTGVVPSNLFQVPLSRRFWRNNEVIVNPKIITTTETDRFDNGIIDVSVIPYIRHQLVQFEASGLRTNRRVYFFFDDVDVTDYIIKPDEMTLVQNNDVAVYNTGFSNTDVITGTSNGATATVVQATRFYDFVNATPSLQDDARRRKRKRILRLANTSNAFAIAENFTTSVTANTGTIGAVEIQGSETLRNFFENSSSNTITLPSKTRFVANNYWGTNGSNTIILMPRRHPKGRSVRAYITGFNNVNQTLSLSNTYGQLFSGDDDTVIQPLPNENVSRDISWTIGDKHFTDYEGKISGTFSIPPGLFRTGERVFRIIDSATNQVDECTTRAEFKFVASGLRQTKQDTVINTVKTTIVPEVLVRPRVRRRDPIAQTFFVDSIEYPNGLFLSKVGLYFYNKDEILPVTVEIRPTVNGYPHSYAVMPNGTKGLDAEYIQTSDDASVETTIAFDNPVFLEPGEYAIVIKSDSTEYEVFVSELGAKVIGTDRTVSEQPYLGSFFKSQNASTWDAIQLEDLCFNLYKCVFNSGGTISFRNDYAQGGTIAADVLYTHIDEKTFPNTSISYVHTYNSGANYYNYNPDTNVIPDGRVTVSDASSVYYITATLSTNDPNISPVIYHDSGLLLAIENYIDTANIDPEDFTIVSGGYYSANVNGTVPLTITDYRGTTFATAVANVNSSGNVANIRVTDGGYGFINTATVRVSVDSATTSNAIISLSSETSATGGPAVAKYISRVVTLAEGFEAGDIKVYLTAYKPSGTDVLVYYKIKNNNDTDSFDDKGWIYMPQTTKATAFSPKGNYNAAIEYQFDPHLSDVGNSVVYTTSTATYTTFNQYAIKIVLTTNDTTVYPIVYDMRAIALPALA